MCFINKIGNFYQIWDKSNNFINFQYIWRLNLTNSELPQQITFPNGFVFNISKLGIGDNNNSTDLSALGLQVIIILLNFWLVLGLCLTKKYLIDFNVGVEIYNKFLIKYNHFLSANT